VHSFALFSLSSDTLYSLSSTLVNSLCHFHFLLYVHSLSCRLFNSLPLPLHSIHSLPHSPTRFLSLNSTLLPTTGTPLKEPLIGGNPAVQPLPPASMHAPCVNLLHAAGSDWHWPNETRFMRLNLPSSVPLSALRDLHLLVCCLDYEIGGVPSSDSRLGCTPICLGDVFDACQSTGWYEAKVRAQST
jgi:hypothetical protein